MDDSVSIQDIDKIIQKALKSNPNIRSNSYSTSSVKDSSVSLGNSINNGSNNDSINKSFNDSNLTTKNTSDGVVENNLTLDTNYISNPNDVLQTDFLDSVDSQNTLPEASNKVSKTSFWQKLFKRKKSEDDFLQPPSVPMNSSDELKDFINLRKNYLGTDNPFLMDKPRSEKSLSELNFMELKMLKDHNFISDEDFKKWAFSTDEKDSSVLSNLASNNDSSSSNNLNFKSDVVFDKVDALSESVHTSEDINSVTDSPVEISVDESDSGVYVVINSKQDSIRSRLGLDIKKPSVNKLFDKLYEDANTDVDSQLEQYEREQASYAETFEEENPEVDEVVVETDLNDLHQEISDSHNDLDTEKIPFPSMKESSSSSSLTSDSASDEKLLFSSSSSSEEKLIENSDSLSKELLIEDSNISKKELLLEDSIPDEKLLLGSSSDEKLLNSSFREEELLSTSVSDEKLLSDDVVKPALVEDKTLDETVLKESSELVDEKLSKVNLLLDEVESGELDFEIIAVYLEKGVSECRSMIQSHYDLIEIKKKYNYLTSLYEKLPSLSDIRTKWFGVLKKLYEEISSLEKIK